MSMTLSDKIAALRPNEPFYIIGDTLDGVHFIDETVEPVTQEELAAAEPQLQYDADVEAVKQARHAAYVAPDGSDALFMKFQRNEDGVTKQQWLDRVAEINAAHPYPEPPTN